MTNVKAFGCASIMALGIGCADVAQETPTQAEVAQKAQAIIGGVPANSASLNAIGATVVHFPVLNEETGETTVEYFAECTASLIGPQTVLLAKHCIDSFSIIANPPPGFVLPEGTGLFFHMGPDSMNPVRTIEIVGVEKAAVDEGGTIGVGRDVATFHLAEKVTEVSPLTLGVLEARHIGQDFGTIGYGAQDNTGTSGTRFAGTETLRATSGRLYELMFGSYEVFKEYALTGDAPPQGSVRPGQLRLLLSAAAGTADDDGDSDAGGDGEVDEGEDDSEMSDEEIEAYLRDLYDNTYLLDGYEAYVGNVEGNTQTCYGDSGGPLVRSVGGKLRAFGVTSGGLESNQSICDFGTVYATFGKDVMDFLNKSKKWVDPCKGISSLGVCDRDTARRCTALTEGTRRLTKTHCGLLGQTCGADDTGAAVCVDR